MSERASKGSEIKVGALGGINLRKARPQLDSGECDRIFGLYPSQTGALSRIPGKTLWRVYEDGTTPRPVYQGHQAFDGTGNIIVQNGDAIGVYTLDELRNRLEAYSLTPTANSGNLASAIMVHTESNGVNGGQLGSADNVFTQRDITDIQTNGRTTISALSTNQFTLTLGTYRINARIYVGQYPLTSAARCGLYSVTNSAFKTYADATAEILSTSAVNGGYTGIPANLTMYIMGRFRVESASETFQISQAVKNETSSQYGNIYCQGAPAEGITTKNENYAVISLQKE